MYSRIVELEQLDLALVINFKSNERVSRKIENKPFTIENVFECMENVCKTISIVFFQMLPQ